MVQSRFLLASLYEYFLEQDRLEQQRSKRNAPYIYIRNTFLYTIIKVEKNFVIFICSVPHQWSCWSATAE